MRWSTIFENNKLFVTSNDVTFQVQLDDSRVSISTIASSRYVGPIKEKVEDWQRQLKLMNDTLVRFSYRGMLLLERSTFASCVSIFLLGNFSTNEYEVSDFCL